MDEMFEIVKAGAPDAPPEQALYRIQQTYPDGSGGRDSAVASYIHVMSTFPTRRSYRRRTRSAGW